jgi:hypothetical protein
MEAPIVFEVLAVVEGAGKSFLCYVEVLPQYFHHWRRGGPVVTHFYCPG